MAISVHESIMQALVARLAAGPALVTTIARDHRTALPREKCPAILVFETEDRPALKVERTHCAIARELHVTLALIVRSDTARVTADALWVPLVARLAADWGQGITLTLGPTRWADEVADLDACEVRQELLFRYACPPYQLDQNAHAD
jgi:hypothetical protein